MLSICICLTRACLVARSLTRMCAQWRKRRIGLLQARDLLLLRDVGLRAGARARAGAPSRRPSRRRARCGSRPRSSSAMSVHALVEQVAVVGDHQHGAGEVVQQPPSWSRRAHVEVGLGLVEQQHVGPPGEAGGQRDELALAAAQLPGRDVERPRCRATRRCRAPRPPRGRRPPRCSGASARSWWASARVIASRSSASRGSASRASAACSSASISASSGRAAEHRGERGPLVAGHDPAAGGRAPARGGRSPRRRRRSPARRGSAAASTCRRRWGRARRCGRRRRLEVGAARIERPPNDFTRPRAASWGTDVAMVFASVGAGRAVPGKAGKPHSDGPGRPHRSPPKTSPRCAPAVRDGGGEPAPARGRRRRRRMVRTGAGRAARAARLGALGAAPVRGRRELVRRSGTIDRRPAC